MNDFYCEQVFSGKVDVKKVVETDNVLAYYHTQPFWTTHVVVVPKEHITSIFDADDKTLIALISACKEVVTRLNLEKAYKIRTNGGSFQDSKHLHLHILAGEEL